MIGSRTVAVLLLVAASACTFERRAEPEPEGARSGEPRAEVGLGGGEDAALEVVRLFRESVAVGDLSLALVLLDRDAVLADELVGEASEALTRGELLLALRRRHAAGVRFEVEGVPAVAYSGDAVLVVTHLAVTVEAPGAEPELLGTAYESVLLVPDPAGWRIRHLQRSFAPPPG